MTKEDKQTIEQWYADAEQVDTIEDAAHFAQALMDSTEFDYNMTIHAITAGALAMMFAMNNHRNGGLSGYQASCVALQFIKHVNMIDGPFKIVNWEHALYPQYAYRFAQTVSIETAEWLRAEAVKKIAIDDESGRMAHSKVRAHWEWIAMGELPFGLRVVKEDNK